MRLLLFAVTALCLSGVAAHADPITFNVQLSSANPAEANRLFRNGTASVYTANKAFPGILGFGPYSYETYAFAPDGAAFESVSIVDPDINTFFSVYVNSFDPTNLMNNYLADAGSSGDSVFSFVVPTGDNFILVANNVTSGVFGGPAAVTVTGANLAPTPEPASLILLGTGVLGLAGVLRKRRA